MTLPTTVRDVAMLLARIGVGIVFFAHGWQKLVTNGVDGTAAFFDQAGVPLPTVSAWFATGVELLGGAALILGAVVPIAGVLLALDMLGAFIFVHAGKGLFVDKGGYELVLALGAASLLLAAVGAGRLSVDHLLTGRRRAAEPAPAGRA
ncbi:MULTISPECIES: DoxX family protein [unclassified Micromonospora]|uniref:DoxX family protein n=1 Tax=unclassified Micromonospora TaxID=2617518 RepID=UPI00332E803A